MLQFEQAYLSTIYRVYSPSFEVDIRIKQHNKALVTLCEDNGIDTWAVITGFNPHSQEADDEFNLDANQTLGRELTRLGFKHLSAEGVPADDSWQPEASFFVFNISLPQAASLGRTFRQNAIVVGDQSGFSELVWLR
ncbi:DUF3293 domain-containing protein [Enterovibrio norvegicus]|uniref:DUF3293 domain-containing protein n=1 Tax=Enterovibrio norvegicus TaxID=188144 RepID=A0A2N7L440_9GAMM|nr:DUF3293 domain-containing protein [Enterovibrio norvegicus]PML77166.1 hypothetical protein BCT69_20885 [Enterovibrio norvegicus]PMN65680.1 hypothetical protein BCT27_09720 [Enterovibrio norvegicus]PMN88159.1 hypothetical protein BCT23_06965 [Enterovibrio norvegicus]